MSQLAYIIDRVGALPSAEPDVKPLASKPGHVKVRLTFLTDAPKHYRSFQLAVMYGFHGPFMEEACVLLPRKSVTSLALGAFLPAFESLKAHFVIGRNARLVGVALLDEDDSTLAYAC